MANHPVGEKTSIRVTVDRQTLFVDVVMALRVINAAHHVVEVEIAPRAPRGPQKLLAVAGRAARVRVDHEVSVGGKELVLEREVGAVCAVRTAMDRENQR